MPARVAVAAPATIIVNVPAAARVTFDGSPTQSAGERRTFVTPGLDAGANYVYTLRVEIINNGQTIVQTRELLVRAGETSELRFDLSLPGTASR